MYASQFPVLLNAKKVNQVRAAGVDKDVEDIKGQSIKSNIIGIFQEMSHYDKMAR